MVRGVFIDRADAQRTTLEDALKRYQLEVTPTKRAWTAKSETNRARKLISFDPSRLRWFATCSCKPIARGHTLISHAACCGTRMSVHHMQLEPSPV